MDTREREISSAWWDATTAISGAPADEPHQIVNCLEDWCDPWLKGNPLSADTTEEMPRPFAWRFRPATWARATGYTGYTGRLDHEILVPPGPDGRPGERLLAPSQSLYARVAWVPTEAVAEAVTRARLSNHGRRYSEREPR
jgi:hypothetical protein